MLINTIVFFKLPLPTYNFIGCFSVSCFHCLKTFFVKLTHLLFKSARLCSNNHRFAKSHIKRSTSVRDVVNRWRFNSRAHVFFTFSCLGECLRKTFFEIFSIIPWSFTHFSNDLELVFAWMLIERESQLGSK